MKQSNVRRVVVSVIACLALASSYVFAAEEGLSKTAPMALVMQSGDSLELLFPDGSGMPIRETIPIHRAGGLSNRNGV